MDIKQAPIDIKRFVVLSVSLEAVPVPPDRKEKQLPPLPLDFDFNVFNNPKEERQLRIVAQITANREKKVPGYAFRLVAEGWFELSGDAPTDEAGRRDVLVLALPLLIHSMRGYLLNLTAPAPYGPFPLPMPDVRDLLEKKRLADLAKKGRGSEA